jgi:galactokinase
MGRLNFSGTDVFNYFSEHFGKPEITVFSPGRANIIGEHTDYNDGYVLPFAIDRGIWFAAARNNEDVIRIYSLNEAEHCTITLDPGNIQHRPTHWTRYLIQVIETADNRTITGMNIVLGGNLPIGAGISSSSAFTCGCIGLLDALGGWNLSPREMVLWAVKAEHGAGVLGGMMDQYTIITANEGHAMLMDCKEIAHTPVKMPSNGFHFILLHSGVSHNLMFTEYNTRRSECREALSLIRQQDESIISYRDLSPVQLEKHKNVLSPVHYRRVRHVITENQRVLQMVEALKHEDSALAGQLLIESHISLRDDYEVSCPELDTLVELADNIPSWYGGRMMGGGFGGCTINLFAEVPSEEALHQLTKSYETKYGIVPEVIQVHPAQGMQINFL